MRTTEHGHHERFIREVAGTEVNSDALLRALIDEIRRQGLINEYITEYIVSSDSLPTFQ